MESNDKLKKNNNESRVIYYFDDIITFEDFDLDSILKKIMRTYFSL